MNFRGHARRLCGIDPDPRVAANPYLDEGQVGVGESIPYPDASFDVVFADNVLEHLPDPAAVFAAVTRVLRPGGVFLGKTPNASTRTSGSVGAAGEQFPAATRPSLVIPAGCRNPVPWMVSLSLGLKFAILTLGPGILQGRRLNGIMIKALDKVRGVDVTVATCPEQCRE